MREGDCSTGNALAGAAVDPPVEATWGDPDATLGSAALSSARNSSTFCDGAAISAAALAPLSSAQFAQQTPAHQPANWQSLTEAIFQEESQGGALGVTVNTSPLQAAASGQLLYGSCQHTVGSPTNQPKHSALPA